MTNNDSVNIHSTDKTECECCDYIYDAEKYKASELPNVGRNPMLGPCKLFSTIVMCPACLASEIKAQQALAESKDARLQNEKERAEKVTIENALKLDQSIQIQQDIFNAKITSIADIKKAIDDDPAVENKHFTLAKTLAARFEHLLSVISELSEKQKEALTEQRAIQTYYNDLAKKLRADEREQIKLKDVKYQPPVKPIAKPKTIAVKKYDRNAIKDAAFQSKLPEAAIQMVCVARNVTPLEAVRIITGLTENK